MMPTVLSVTAASTAAALRQKLPASMSAKTGVAPVRATEFAVAANAEEKQIRIEVALEGEPELLVDVRLVRSALSNLVRNAIKFTRQSGTVTMRGKVVGTRATIEIEDGCGGLPSEDLEKVFSPFVQLGNKAASGFGLGLAIARQAVDAHGGSLRVQNVPDHGCIFVLELPASAPT